MRILLVTNAFPPLSVIASHRAYGWARAWAAAGHEVHVLTSTKYRFDGPRDLVLPTDGLHVHTVSYPWMDQTRQNVTMGNRNDRSSLWRHLKQKTRFIRNRLGLLADIRMLLVPFLVRLGLRIVSDKDFDVIVSAYGPSSVIIAAALLQRRTNIPLVVDYHDLWSENYAQPRTTFGKRLSHAFEQAIVKRALMLVTVSHGLADRLEKSFGVRPYVAYFGYLEDDDDPPSSSSAPQWKPQLVYAGRVYEKYQTGPKFFGCLARVLARRPELLDSFCVDFYGPDQCALQSMVEGIGVASVTQFNGELPQQKILAIEREAVGLLFFDWVDASAKGVLTGKLFEYLRNRRPIIFIGAGFETEASELARRSGTAVILQTEEEIERFLIDWPASLPTLTPDEAFILSLSCKRQAHLVILEITRKMRT